MKGRAHPLLKPGTVGVLAVLAGLVVLPACRALQQPLRIGGRTGTEGALLCEIAARHLEKRLHKPVARNYDLGDSLQAHQAILTATVDAYPEYAAPALSSILRVDLSSDPGVALERLRMDYRRLFRMDWLPPLGFDHRTVMVVRASDATRFKVTALSELENVADGWALAATREFTASRWGLPILAKHYRVDFSKPTAVLGEPQTYQALREGKATLVAGFASDGALSLDEFRPLRDDRNAFPANPVAFVLRLDGDRATPGLRKALEELSGKISLERMREMNRAVDFERKSVAQVAAAFLAGAGL